MPINCAAPLSSETASIACPALDFLINNVSPIIITIQQAIVTIASPVTVRAPPASANAGTGTMDANEIVFAPKIRSAIFCNR